MIEKGLAGIIDLVVKYSTLQEYGVGQVFFLENANVDTSQKNVVFLVRGEKPRQVQTVAGEYFRSAATPSLVSKISYWHPDFRLISSCIRNYRGRKVDDVESASTPCR